MTRDRALSVLRPERARTWSVRRSVSDVRRTPRKWHGRAMVEDAVPELLPALRRLLEDIDEERG